MERTISGRENNNNQNIWDKSTYILSTMLYNEDMSFINCNLAYFDDNLCEL